MTLAYPGQHEVPAVTSTASTTGLFSLKWSGARFDGWTVIGWTLACVSANAGFNVLALEAA